jgi:hypothetical protein
MNGWNPARMILKVMKHPIIRDWKTRNKRVMELSDYRSLLEQLETEILDWVRMRGVGLGLPVVQARPEEMAPLKQQGLSLQKIGRPLRCSRSTVKRGLIVAASSTT